MDLRFTPESLSFFLVRLFCSSNVSLSPFRSWNPKLLLLALWEMPVLVLRYWLSVLIFTREILWNWKVCVLKIRTHVIFPLSRVFWRLQMRHSRIFGLAILKSMLKWFFKDVRFRFLSNLYKFFFFLTGKILLNWNWRWSELRAHFIMPPCSKLSCV